MVCANNMLVWSKVEAQPGVGRVLFGGFDPISVPTVEFKYSSLKKTGFILTHLQTDLLPSLPPHARRNRPLYVTGHLAL